MNSPILTELYVRAGNSKAKRVQFVTICSSLDIDDPQPAITLMMEHEN
jgi:hypothetical protein